MFGRAFDLQVSIVTFLCLCVIPTSSRRVKRVVGGKEVLCGTQPRIASLRNSTMSTHLCGATLLTPYFALTAAHCVHYDAKQYKIFLNNYCNEDRQYPTAEVEKIIIHSKYDRHSLAHDIALLRINLGNYNTKWLYHSILPSLSDKLSDECMVYGYGYRDVNVWEVSERLMGGPMRVVPLERCGAVLGPVAAPPAAGGMLCALGDGVDACQGDSGSPLLCGGVVAAVSSYGASCAVPGLPGSSPVYKNTCIGYDKF